MSALELPRRGSLRAVAPRPWILAALSVLAGGGAVFVFGLVAGRPITFPDEVIYTDLARDLAHGRGLDVAGLPMSVWTYGPAYLALLAPVFRAAPSVHAAYLGARALNALLFTTTAVPLFLIARSFVTRRSALLVAAGGVALPAAVYTTKLQTESLAYPLATWIAAATLSVIWLPRKRRQLVLLALLLAAPFVRFEFAALLPSCVAACLVCADGSLRARIRRLLPLVAGTVLVAVGAALFVVASTTRGGADNHGLNTHYLSIDSVVGQLSGIVAAFDLATGIVPFALVVAVAASPRVGGRRAGWIDARTRVLAIVTLFVLGGLTLAGGIYLAGIAPASRPSPPPDRYVFYAIPLALLIFARWVERGAPVSSGLRRVCIAAAAVPVVVAAVEVRGDGFTATSNSLSYMPWMFVRALTPGPTWLLLVGVYSFGCAWLLRSAPSRPRRLVKVVVRSIAVCTVCAFGYVGLGSWNARGHTPPGGWLDARTRAGVIGVWETKPSWRQAFALWETHVMNANLGRVYYLRKPDILGPETKVQRGADGELRDHGTPLTARYVLTAAHTRVVGRLIARQSGLALYEVAPPLRLASR